MLSLRRVPGWRLARSVRHVDRGGRHACALELLPVDRTMFAHYASMTLTTIRLHPTRLETRTKESNMCASLRVIETRGRNESKGCPRRLRWEAMSPNGFAASSTDLFCSQKGLSKSVSVGTRKMVNYAWIGRSQRKHWWKPVAILTCKSIVEFGYSGERLIEPSSSWFPPKFPSG